MKMSSISEQRRNIFFSILNRTFGEVGKTLADPTIVFSLFVRQLGASNLLVGLLSTIRYAGWFLPQVFVGGHLQHQARRGFLYVIGESSRCLGYLILAILILTFPTSKWLLPMFFTIFALSYIGHGTGSVPRFDVIGRAVPASMRGSFFARSNLVAGVFGFGAGFVVQAILRANGSGPPVQRYAFLILLSIIFYVLAIGMFRRIREHDSPIQKGKASLQRTLRAVPALLRGDSDYRRLVITLVLTDAARRLIDPFYIIFATEVLGVPIYYAGIYLSVLVFSKILSNVLWDLFSRWLDNRRTLQLASAAALLVPGLAVLFAAFGQHGASGNGLAFAIVFVMMGIRDSGKHIGKRSVFLDIVAEEERPIRWGTLNSMLGIVSFLPVLAGTLIDGIGYTVTFALVSLVSLFGLWSSLRIRPLPSNGAVG
ncbi:MFS transporter [Candidatus Bipolaricaulota bacterium]|nr:MFS transporter [Candidatus Bipolaricaulota bacterium]